MFRHQQGRFFFGSLDGGEIAAFWGGGIAAWSFLLTVLLIKGGDIRKICLTNINYDTMRTAASLAPSAYSVDVMCNKLITVMAIEIRRDFSTIPRQVNDTILVEQCQFIVINLTLIPYVITNVNTKMYEIVCQKTRKTIIFTTSEK